MANAALLDTLPNYVKGAIANMSSVMEENKTARKRLNGTIASRMDAVILLDMTLVWEYVNAQDSGKAVLWADLLKEGGLPNGITFHVMGQWMEWHKAVTPKTDLKGAYALAVALMSGGKSTTKEFDDAALAAELRKGNDAEYTTGKVRELLEPREVISVRVAAVTLHKFIAGHATDAVFSSEENIGDKPAVSNRALSGWKDLAGDPAAQARMREFASELLAMLDDMS